LIRQRIATQGILGAVEIGEIVVFAGITQLVLELLVFRKRIRLPPFYVVLSVIAMPFLSLFWSQDPSVTLFVLRTQVKIFFLVTYLLNRFSDRGEIEFFLHVYTGAGIFFAMLNISDTFFHFSERVTLGGRSGYLISSPNAFGDYLLTLLPFYLTAGAKKGFSSKVCFAILLLGLVQTFSRGSWLGFLASLICITILSGRIISRKMVILFLVGVLVVASSQVIGTWTSKRADVTYTVTGRFVQTVQMLRGERKSGSDLRRELLYRATLETFREYPWLGLGEGVFADQLVIQDKTKINTHSTFTNILGSRGLIGLSLWLYMLACLTFSLLKRYRGANGEDKLSLYAIGALVGTTVHQFVIDGHILPYFWTVATIGIALASRKPYVSRLNRESYDDKPIQRTISTC